jgi:hypothetical protein
VDTSSFKRWMTTLEARDLAAFQLASRHVFKGEDLP